MSFKTCPKCGFAWADRASFLSDPVIELVGYQPDFRRLVAGLFLFNHSCRGSFAVKVEPFVDLHSGPVFEKRLTGGPDCLGYCKQQDNLQLCPRECECAFVRHVLAAIRSHPKSGRPAS